MGTSTGSMNLRDVGEKETMLDEIDWRTHAASTADECFLEISAVEDNMCPRTGYRAGKSVDRSVIFGGATNAVTSKVHASDGTLDTRSKSMSRHAMSRPMSAGGRAWLSLDSFIRELGHLLPVSCVCLTCIGGRHSLVAGRECPHASCTVCPSSIRQCTCNSTLSLLITPAASDSPQITTHVTVSL